MTPDNRKRRGINWGSAIGWLIFILVIAGGPIINLLRRILGGTIALPTNTANLLPIVIGGLVVLSIIVSALRALGNANRTSTRLPSELNAPARPPSAPMPPFGGAARRPSAPPASPRAFTLPSSSTQQQRLPTPRFDPVINPLLLAIGIVGLLVLGGAALLLFAQGGP